MATIAEQWREFERACGLATAPGIQRSEMRRAFFAGAFSALVELGMRGQVEPREAWAELYSEAERFGRDQVARDRRKPPS